MNLLHTLAVVAASMLLFPFLGCIHDALLLHHATGVVPLSTALSSAALIALAVSAQFPNLLFGIVTALLLVASFEHESFERLPLAEKVINYVNVSWNMSRENFESQPWSAAVHRVSDILDFQYTMRFWAMVIVVLGVAARLIVFAIAAYCCDTIAQLDVMAVALGISTDEQLKKYFNASHRIVSKCMFAIRVLWRRILRPTDNGE